VGGITNPIDLPQQIADELSGDGDQGDSDQGDSSDDKGDKGKVDPSLRLINATPISLDQSIDEPVTSGGDVVIGDIPGGGN
jgi:hypothetical protein